MSISYNFEPKAGVTSSKQEIKIKYHSTGVPDEGFLEKLAKNPFSAIGSAVTDFVKKNILGEAGAFPSQEISIGEISGFKVIEKSTSRIIKPAFHDTPTTVFDFEGFDLEFTIDKTSYYANFLMHLQIVSAINEASDSSFDTNRWFIQPEFMIIDRVHYPASPGQRLRKIGGIPKIELNPLSIAKGIGSFADAVTSDVVEEYVYRNVVFYGYGKTVESEDKPITESLKAFSPIRTCNIDEMKISFPDEVGSFIAAVTASTKPVTNDKTSPDVHFA